LQETQRAHFRQFHRFEVHTEEQQEQEGDWRLVGLGYR
jgi:hypothetical protein